MSDYKIGVDGEVQVNMKVIIDSYLIDDIEWEDE